FLEVGTVVEEGLDRSGWAVPGDAGEQQPDVLAGQVGVLLRAGEGELLLDDLPREDEPGVVVPGPAQVLQRAQGVEAREVGRWQPPAGGIEPERRGAGQDPDAVVVPDRVPVADPLDVV